MNSGRLPPNFFAGGEPSLTVPYGVNSYSAPKNARERSPVDLSLERLQAELEHVNKLANELAIRLESVTGPRPERLGNAQNMEPRPPAACDLVMALDVLNELARLTADNLGETISALQI